VQELCETIGPVKKVTMISAGHAEVLFQKRTDALKAMQDYNQIKLDGTADSTRPPPLFVLLASSGPTTEPHLLTLNPADALPALLH
jgi:hypothetical protein